MKVVCDVCEAAPASVVCFADAAAMCEPCDARVHAANKLAAKHQRAPLISSSAGALKTTSTTTCCDICQEVPPFLFFCLEDRAILCRDCDLSLHPSTALSAKHRRFFLTGISVDHVTPWPSSTTTTTTSTTIIPPHTTTTSITTSAHLPSSSSSDEDDDDASFVHLLKSKKKKKKKKKKKNKSTITLAHPIQRNPALVPNVKSNTHAQDPSIQPNNNTSITSPNMPSSSSSPPPPPTISIRRLSTGSIPFVAPVLTTTTSVSHILHHGGMNPLSHHLHQDPHILNYPHDNLAASSVVDSSHAAHDTWKKLAEQLLNDDADHDSHEGLHSTSSSSGRAPASSGFKGKDEGVAEVPEMVKLPTISVADLWTYDSTWSSTKAAAGEQNCNDISSGFGVEAWDFDCLFDSSKSASAETMDDDVSVVPDIISVSFGKTQKRRKFYG